MTIQKENADGTFTGEHEVRGKKLALLGRCYEEGGGKPHRIFWLVVPATGFLYSGTLTNDKLIEGHRSPLDPSQLLGDEKSRLLDGEEWEGSKT
jgi:hypothetical protein